MALRKWVEDAVNGKNKADTRIVRDEILGRDFFGRTIRQKAAYAALSDEEFIALASILGEEELRAAGFKPAAAEVADAAAAAEAKIIAENRAANAARHQPLRYSERDRDEVSDGFGAGLSNCGGF